METLLPYTLGSTYLESLFLAAVVVVSRRIVDLTGGQVSIFGCLLCDFLLV